MIKKGVPKRDILSYAAGIIDGEGCIGIHKHGKHKGGTVIYGVRVIVGNTDRRLVEFLKDNFGGSFSKRKVVGNRKKAYAWELSSNLAANFLRIIYPYLLLKQKQAKICIDFQGNGIPMRKATEKEKNIRNKMIFKISLLNKRGIGGQYV